MNGSWSEILRDDPEQGANFRELITCCAQPSVPIAKKSNLEVRLHGAESKITRRLGENVKLSRVEVRSNWPEIKPTKTFRTVHCKST